MKGLNHIKLSSILFNNTQKFYVPEKTYEDYDNSMLVLSANRNLNSYGYTLSNNMIENLNVNYTLNGVKVTLSINDCCYGNLPYNLADMFSRIVNDADANPSEVVDTMKLSLNIED